MEGARGKHSQLHSSMDLACLLSVPSMRISIGGFLRQLAMDPPNKISPVPRTLLPFVLWGRLKS